MNKDAPTFGICCIKPLLILSVVLLTFSTPSYSTIEEELSWLIGKWQVTTFVKQKNGEFAPVAEKSYYKAEFNRDRRSILAQFYQAEHHGFYGIHLISETAPGQYEHYYLNARAQRRLTFTGTMRSDGYYLERFGGYGDNGHYYREKDQQISANKFIKNIYESSDGQSDWREGDYYFVMERLAK